MAQIEEHDDDLDFFPVWAARQRQEGREEGRRQGLLDGLLALGTALWGPPGPRHLQRLHEADADDLQRWLAAGTRAAGWHDLLGR